MDDKNKEFKELTEDELNGVIGGTNWKTFGKCILSQSGGASPALAELVAAIVSGNWQMVAILSKSESISSNPIVVNCKNSN